MAVLPFKRPQEEEHLNVMLTITLFPYELQKLYKFSDIPELFSEEGSDEPDIADDLWDKANEYVWNTLGIKGVRAQSCELIDSECVSIDLLPY